jgi:hypothetical protein
LTGRTDNEKKPPALSRLIMPIDNGRRPFFMDRKLSSVVTLVTLIAAASAGCRSPYYQDQGALLGGATGAGLGAIIGNQSGHALGGAAIGGAVGALTGAAVGSGMDDIEARNRAQIAAQLGRPAPTGAVTIEDVVAMTRAGVHEELIVTHIHNNGAVSPLRADDLIFLQQQGVSPRVISAMQAPPPPRRVVVQEPQPVIVERYYDPYWGPYYHRPYYGGYGCGPRRGGVSWGVAVGG